MRSPKGYSTMRAGAHARTIFAGFGVTGSLLAAVGAVFLVVGGVMAFDQWPAEPADPPAKSLAVAQAAANGPSPAPRVVALPAALPAAAPGTGAAGPARG
ncbi:MAG: hypothetical protein JWM73_268, partial [Solirubrobacterales bacterium]|nr:hypothetical protein [Solirubrobacterales bacterium]